MIGFELFMACAPNVAPQTIEQIVRVESSGDPIALNINGAHLSRKPRDSTDAAALAKHYIEAGYSVDLGLMQINSRNLARLGYRLEEMFEPCKNIAAGARVLTAFYAQARPQYQDEQSALRAALSAYNTGSLRRGFTNGYVSRYFNGSPIHVPTSAVSSALNPYTADTAVFIRKEQKMINTNERTIPVVSTASKDAGSPGVQVEYTAEEAAANGAFEETAISEADAWESNADVGTDDLNATGIVVAGKTPGQEDR
jgi:type IV secretion system protein VirB1